SPAIAARAARLPPDALRARQRSDGSVCSPRRPAVHQFARQFRVWPLSLHVGDADLRCGTPPMPRSLDFEDLHGKYLACRRAGETFTRVIDAHRAIRAARRAELRMRALPVHGAPQAAMRRLSTG